MKIYDAAEIRNLALVGHGHCGKTSMASALLFCAGASGRLGKVDQGTAPTDFDPDEIDRKISISTALAHLEHKGRKINLLDTPGYGNFIADARPALRVAEGALVIVSAAAGVEVLTERAWKMAEESGCARLIAINKIDRDNASFERALESVQKRLARAAVPVQIPLTEGPGFSAILDLVGNQLLSFAPDESGKCTAGPVPAEARERADRWRERLAEAVAETDDALLEKFLEKGELEPEELKTALRRAVVAGRLFPVYACSALRNVGCATLLDAASDLVPSPAERGPLTAQDAGGNGPVELLPDSRQPLAAFVFKTIADPFAGKISLVRVYSGTLRGDQPLHNHTRDVAERVAALALLQGKQQVPVPELRAGDLGALIKLKETSTGDSLGDRSRPVRFAPVEYPEPAITFAIQPKTRADEDKISTALHRLAEEDPGMRYGRDPQTHELLLSGAGDTHVEVLVSRLKRKFGAEVILHPPKVPYRETIRRRAEAHGRHKKQTGGHGQFADCKIRIEPLPRGKDFEFVDEIFGGAIPRNFIPAVEKGIQEARQHGPLAGYPVVDFRVVLYDGQYHEVDSSELAFKIAGSLAFKDAMEKAMPTLLEPIMRVEVVAPEEFMGDLMGDLTSRRGRVQGTDQRDGSLSIQAQVPMAEMLSYAPALKSITGGRGTYHMEMAHYEEVPAQIQERIIAEARRARADKPQAAS
jgi:elongation factor G